MGINVPVVNVEIEINAMQKPVKAIFQHEIPIFQAKFGEPKVKPTIYQCGKTYDIDSLKDEHMRLCKAHGNDDGGTAWAEQIYGFEKGAATMDSLKSAMEGDFKRFFTVVPVPETKKTPETNNPESKKVTKTNLSKPLMLAWLKEQGIEKDGTKLLSKLTAKELTEWAKVKMREMIAEHEKPDPDGEMGTKSMTRLVIQYQEEG